MAFTIKDLIVTLSIVTLGISIKFLYDECVTFFCYAGCHYAKCYYAERHYAECRGAI